MQSTIRPMLEEDRSHIEEGFCDMLDRVGQLEPNRVDTDLMKGGNLERLETFLDHQIGGTILIIEADGKPAGFAAYFLRRPDPATEYGPFKAQETVAIQEVWIHPTYRRLRLGSQLVSHIREKHAGMTAQVLALAQNETARLFCTSIGLQPLVTVYYGG